MRGALQNTAGYLEYRGIPIPHPPVISPNPTTGATIQVDELASFNEGINRAGQLESTCNKCSDVTPGSPVTGSGELDPIFPQFRTTPLWGVGQRMFFLHDGRTSDLLQAIQQHFSAAATSTSAASPAYPPSEANAVVQNFRKLSAADQQAVLDFLRSL